MDVKIRAQVSAIRIGLTSIRSHFSLLCWGKNDNAGPKPIIHHAFVEQNVISKLKATVNILLFTVQLDKKTTASTLEFVFIIHIDSYLN